MATVERHDRAARRAVIVVGSNRRRGARTCTDDETARGGEARCGQEPSPRNLRTIHWRQDCRCRGGVVVRVDCSTSAATCEKRFGEGVDAGGECLCLVGAQCVVGGVAVGDTRRVLVDVERCRGVGESGVDRACALLVASSGRTATRTWPGAGGRAGEVGQVGVRVAVLLAGDLAVATSSSSSTAPLAIGAGSSSTRATWCCRLVDVGDQLVGDRGHPGGVLSSQSAFSIRWNPPHCASAGTSTRASISGSRSPKLSGGSVCWI